jgi:hypothetical protein
MLNWILKKDGWHKVPKSTTRGNADYFRKPAPPVRDGATGHPIGKNGNVDWKRVIRESNKQHGG